MEWQPAQCLQYFQLPKIHLQIIPAILSDCPYCRQSLQYYQTAPTAGNTIRLPQLFYSSYVGVDSVHIFPLGCTVFGCNAVSMPAVTCPSCAKLPTRYLCSTDIVLLLPSVHDDISLFELHPGLRCGSASSQQNMELQHVTICVPDSWKVKYKPDFRE